MPADKSERVIGAEPTPGQFIREIHCWIATYPDGTKGIIAGGLEGLGLTTLLSSHREKAEAPAPITPLGSPSRPACPEIYK
jgi:hypothetical protein